MQIENVISYYQECYRQEFRDNSILNYLGSKVDARFYFKKINELCEEGDAVQINQDLGDQLYKYFEIHKKEKTLIASSFFVTGKMMFLGKKRTICAPLISTPVTLIGTSGRYTLKYNFDGNICNTMLLNVIKANHDLSDSFVLEIEALIKNGKPEHQDIIKIAEKIKEYVTIDYKGLESLPSLITLSLIHI